jgi:hypothetical protein
VPPISWQTAVHRTVFFDHALMVWRRILTELLKLRLTSAGNVQRTGPELCSTVKTIFALKLEAHLQRASLKRFPEKWDIF